MSADLFGDLDVSVTPQLRAFLRAELAQIVHFYSVEGEKWKPYKIAAQTRLNADIPGSIGDDAIRRFLYEPERHDTRRVQLQAIAGFLLAFDFITKRDLRHYGNPSYDRAASAMAWLYQSSIDQTRNRALLGVHRYYRTVGPSRIAEWALTLGSPDEGCSVSASLSVSVFAVEDLEYLLARTDLLDPIDYPVVRDELSVLEPEVEGTAPGLAVLTPTEGFAVIGGDEAALQMVLTLETLHFWRGDFMGAHVAVSSRYAEFRDEQAMPETETSDGLEELRRYTSRLILYPQGKRVRRLPEIDAGMGDSSNGREKGRGLSFQATVEGRMNEKDKIRLEGERYELAVEEALAACPDETARLARAIDLMRADHAVAAIEAGADVNAMHKARNVPMVHAAASLGMFKVIRAMLARDVDLTVRDRFNRRPSACTGKTERTVPLRDMLAAAQAEQLQAKGMQPGQPQPPEND